MCPQEANAPLYLHPRYSGINSYSSWIYCSLTDDIRIYICTRTSSACFYIQEEDKKGEKKLFPLQSHNSDAIKIDRPTNRLNNRPTDRPTNTPPDRPIRAYSSAMQRINQGLNYMSVLRASKLNVSISSKETDLDKKIDRKWSATRSSPYKELCRLQNIAEINTYKE